MVPADKLPVFLQALAFFWLLLFTAVNTFYSQLPAKMVQRNVLASDPLKGPWDKYLVQVNYSKSGEGKGLRWGKSWSVTQAIQQVTTSGEWSLVLLKNSKG